MPPLVVSGVFLEEVVASQPPTASDVEEDIPSKEVVEETGQALDVVKGIESMQASNPLAAQDPRATQTPFPKVPHLDRFLV